MKHKYFMTKNEIEGAIEKAEETAEGYMFGVKCFGILSFITFLISLIIPKALTLVVLIGVFAITLFYVLIVLGIELKISTLITRLMLVEK